MRTTRGLPPERELHRVADLGGILHHANAGGFQDGYLAENYPGREAEMFRQLSEYQPLGRMGNPQEVAALALYLCSEEAAFITGQAYPIDGGVLAT